jgi:predicted MFS family arabinose efflux permease
VAGAASASFVLLDHGLCLVTLRQGKRLAGPGWDGFDAGRMSFAALGDLRGRALWVVLGAMVCQLGAGLTYVFSVLQKDIIGELDWSRTMFSAARAPVFLVIAAASPVVGTVVVRWGTRAVLVASTLLLGAAYVIVSQMTELWHFYAANLLIGVVVAGLGDVVTGAVVARWVVRSRGLALGIVYSGTNLAGFLALPLVAAVSAARGWRDAVLVLAGAAVLTILPFAAIVVREPRCGEAALDRDETRPGDEPGERDLDLAEAVRTRSFWILAYLLFAFFFYFIAMIEHTVAYLTDIGFTKVEAGAAFGFAIGLGVWSKLGAGAVADRLPSRAAIGVDFALLTLSAVIVVWVGAPGVLTAFLFSFGIAVAARDVVYPLIIADCFGVTYLARVYGALMFALLPGGVLGPVFAATVFDRTGTYTPAFAVFSFLNAAALIAIRFLRDERDGRSSPAIR